MVTATAGSGLAVGVRLGAGSDTVSAVAAAGTMDPGAAIGMASAGALLGFREEAPVLPATALPGPLAGVATAAAFELDVGTAGTGSFRLWLERACGGALLLALAFFGERPAPGGGGLAATRAGVEEPERTRGGVDAAERGNGGLARASNWSGDAVRALRDTSGLLRPGKTAESSGEEAGGDGAGWGGGVRGCAACLTAGALAVVEPLVGAALTRCRGERCCLLPAGPRLAGVVVRADAGELLDAAELPDELTAEAALVAVGVAFP